MHYFHVNHLAIVASALIQWLLGALWFSPVLFAKPWTAMVNAPQENKHKSMVAGMITSFIVSLVLSFVLVHILHWAGALTFGRGALVGFILWAGFIAAPLSAGYIYESRPFKLFAINTGYWLVALLISGGLLAVWR
jgi:hypothetical protein